MPGIGIDTHKRTLSACAVDDVGSVIDEGTFSCDEAAMQEAAPESRVREVYTFSSLDTMLATADAVAVVTVLESGAGRTVGDPGAELTFTDCRAPAEPFDHRQRRSAKGTRHS